MADQPSAPAAAPAAAPAPAAPATAPEATAAAPAAVEAAPSEAPVKETQAPLEAPEAPVEAATPKDSPSLLSSAEGKPPKTPAPGADAGAKKKDAPKDAPAPAKDAADPAKKDATPSKPETAPAPAPLQMSDLTLPEGMTTQAEGGQKFLELMNNAGATAKERAQGLLDLHRTEIERVHREAFEHQRRVWDDLNAGWRESLRNDPQIGGNRLHTHLSMAKGMIEEHLSPEDATNLLRHVDANGMGNYPPFIKLLVGLAKRMNVFEDGLSVAPPVPPKPARGPGNRGWYRNSGQDS